VAVLFETGIFVGTRVAHIIIWSNMRRFSCCVAAALSFAQVAAANAEDEGKWELEQHGGAAFALSYKQSASISNQIATSELGFLCDRRSRGGVIGTILVPFDGTFESHQDQSLCRSSRNPMNMAHLTFFKSGRMGVNFSFPM
jgi:hypothetical protein